MYTFTLRSSPDLQFLHFQDLTNSKHYIFPVFQRFSDIKNQQKHFGLSTFSVDVDVAYS